jgi:hypothetical protein
MGRTRTVIGLFLVSTAVAALSWTGIAAANSDPPGHANGPRVIPAEKHGVSDPLDRTSPLGAPEPEGLREIPKHLLRQHGPKKGILDPVLQSSAGGVDMPSAAGTFDGGANVNGVLPPDANGAVGPNHYVQWVNLSFSIYDKATGARIYGPAAGNTLWQALGGLCASRNNGDPIVIYDHLAGRWVMSQFAFQSVQSGPFYQCIAVSQTSDPTGAYYLYQFKISDTKLNDYPKLAIWPDGYYMTTNQFFCSSSGCSWGGQGVVAFEREKMLVGAPASMMYFDLFTVDPNLGGMLPSHLDGPVVNAGKPNYFAEMDDSAWGYSPDQVQIWAFHVDWATPANSTFTKIVSLPTQPFDSNMCGYSSACIGQPGTTARVDALSDRLMYRLQYRDFGDHASLVTNHTVDVDSTDRAGIRWYELRDSGSGWTIYQQGTYAPDADNRWMGSIAMDKAGNMALGYSVSSTSTFPSVRYTGRLAGDPVGSLPQGETTLVDGTGSQLSATGRWGDYSSMAVDPTDDCTFWYTQEYYAATSTAGWRTRVGSFKFPSCGSAPADYSLSASPSSVTLVQGASATSTITVTPQNGFSGSVSLSASGLPGGVTASFNPSSTTSTSTLTLSASSTASTGTVTVTITGTSGSLTRTTTISLTVNAPPSYTLSASPGSVTISQGASGTTTITVTPQNGFTGNVSLSASGLPGGVTASFTPSSTASTSTLTLTANSTASKGTVTVKITGTSGALKRTTTISLTVNVVPNYKLSASPTSLTIDRGFSGTSTITVTPQNGFNGNVSLSVSGLPGGVTASFNPPSTASKSTLTLSVSLAATPGAATVTITGTSGTLSHTTNVSLTVQ